MNTSKTYDLIGIGIGPFNLGLAALADQIEHLDYIFFDKQPAFNWHSGMLLEHARLQVPYQADLVTLADPTSRFSYLNYLHLEQRLIQLGITEQYFITRKEYNQYCRWVVSELDNLFFGMECVAVHYLEASRLYSVKIRDIASGSTFEFQAKRLVIGIGTVPSVPECALSFPCENIIHSSSYLFEKERLLQQKKITIVGSGQSAAEIFYDLLQEPERFEHLHMFTRASDFFPMDYSRYALEKTSPEYIDYFFSLSNKKKKEVLSRQNALFKGINFSLIADIHDMQGAIRILYPFKKNDLCTSSELRAISVVDDKDATSPAIKMDFWHREMEKELVHYTGAVILATGYKYEIPAFLQSVKDRIRFNEDGLYDVQRNYSIDYHNSIFAQNAELHTHGFNAPDLGMGPYRNMVIINTILGSEHFKIPKRTAFQTFGIPTELTQRTDH
ncbi:MAG TPA: SidA/IucD/PvdA family monooxygenase [Puia sp.]|nr:SidA/IucD/PvdA family monooxygenase [Puia sp.]